MAPPSAVLAEINPQTFATMEAVVSRHFRSVLRIHDLRHRLASALANAGTPLFEIGAILGHRQLSTTTATPTTRPNAWSRPPPPSGRGTCCRCRRK